MGLQVVRDDALLKRSWLPCIRGFRRWVTDKTRRCRHENCASTVSDEVGRFLTLTWTMASRARKIRDPQLNRLMRDAHARRFDVVVCWRFDRFSRSVSHLCRALETFNALDIQFVSLCEQVDTSTPTGKLVFTILGAVAEGERNLIAERVRAGLRNARAKGKTLGRPRVDIDMAQIESLRASGDSWRTIARKLGLSVGTVHAAAKARTAKALCA